MCSNFFVLERCCSALDMFWGTVVQYFGAFSECFRRLDTLGNMTASR